MHTGTCQHVNGESARFSQPACPRCARPMEPTKMHAPALRDKPLDGLKFLLEPGLGCFDSLGGLVKFPKFTIIGSR